MDVVAVNAVGQERLVRRLGPDLIKGGGVYRPYGAVGRDGWLSVDVSPSVGVLPGMWMLVDLRDPARPPQFVPFTQVIGGAWSGTGWFATVTPGTIPGSRSTSSMRTPARPGRSAVPSACPVAART